MIDYSLSEMIEMAKKSDYGYVWYTNKGPIQITNNGELVPLGSGPNDPILNADWRVNLRQTNHQS